MLRLTIRPCVHGVTVLSVIDYDSPSNLLGLKSGHHHG